MKWVSMASWKEMYRSKIQKIRRPLKGQKFAVISRSSGPSLAWTSRIVMAGLPFLLVQCMGCMLACCNHSTHRLFFLFVFLQFFFAVWQKAGYASCLFAFFWQKGTENFTLWMSLISPCMVWAFLGWEDASCWAYEKPKSFFRTEIFTQAHPVYQRVCQNWDGATRFSLGCKGALRACPALCALPRLRLDVGIEAKELHGCWYWGEGIALGRNTKSEWKWKWRAMPMLLLGCVCNW